MHQQAKQKVCTTLVGVELGHVFGTGGGGVNTWVSETLTQGEVSAGLVFVL